MRSWTSAVAALGWSSSRRPPAGLARSSTTVPTPCRGRILHNAVPWRFGSLASERLVWPLPQGRGVKVAVIDTGVNANPPDLREAVLPGKDFRSKGGDGRTSRLDTLPVGDVASRGTRPRMRGVQHTRTRVHGDRVGGLDLRPVERLRWRQRAIGQVIPSCSSSTPTG